MTVIGRVTRVAAAKRRASTVNVTMAASDSDHGLQPVQYWAMSKDSVSAFLIGLTFPSQSIAESVIAKVVGEQVSLMQLKTLTDEEFEEMEMTPDVISIIRQGFQKAEVLAHHMLASNCEFFLFWKYVH